MLSAKECRQRAQDWLHLAATASDFFAQDALVRRASDCEKIAKHSEKKPFRRGGPPPHDRKDNSTCTDMSPRPERWVCRENTGAAPLRRL